MTAPPDDTDLHAAIAALRAERDAALLEKAALAEELAAQTVELAERKSEFGERIAQQAATIDVLKVMSASPGDPQPVFDLIVRRATELCDGLGTTLLEFDGGLVHYRANYFIEAFVTAANVAYAAAFPSAPTRGSISCRAILDREIVHIRDTDADLELSQVARELLRATLVRSQISIPLMRDGQAIGAISLAAHDPGGFSDSQVALLETFAEQAVIAITSAETYRALQTRTADLQESLEYQTATSDVLKVISRSTFDLQPVLKTLVETAARLCDADMAAIGRPVGNLWRLAANFGFPAEFEAHQQASHPLGPDSPTVAARTVREKVPVHIHDAAAVPGYPDASIRLGKQRTSLGVPLLREGEVIGYIVLARQRVEPFTDRQIELVSTFADQAVIAIENTRLITEQREALEQQTATAEVLQVINSSPGDLAPVFEAMLEKATRLCEAPFGYLRTWDGERFHFGAVSGDPEFSGWVRRRSPLLPDRDDDSPLGRIIKGEQVVRFTVAPGDEGHWNSAGFKEMVAVSGMRSGILVALKKDEALLGTISVYRQEVRPFTDQQVALLENFADQAVIAIENTRLINAQREALEQQTATAEVLQVINASPGNLAPVFDAMLERAMRLCGAAFGSLYTYDGERFHSVAQRGVPPAFAAFRAENPPLLTPGGGPATVLETRRPFQVLDVRAHENYRPDYPGVRAMVELGGVRTILTVPLVKDEVFLGYISIFRQEVRAFSDKQIALLENFAAQAVIAIENTRLISEQREALEQQTATAEVLQVINASPGNLTPVFDAILDKAHALCGAATGSLQLYDGEFFRAVATRGLPDEITSKLRQPHRSGLLDALLRDVPFIQITDIADPALTGGDKTLAVAHDIAGVRTYLRLPLRKDDALLGVIIAGRPEVRPFSQKEISLLQSFAAQAVIAMENARLLEEIRQRQAELRVTFDNMADGVAMFDGKFRLAAWNRNFQELLDIRAAVLAEGPTYAEYLRILAERGEFGTEDIEAELGRRLEHTDRELRLERARPNGQVIEVRRNAVPDGGFVLIYSDITERKRSEAEIRAARDAAEAAYRDLKTAQANLIQAEKMASLGQLTAGIAHEIKNPLNFVNNFAALSVDLLDELKETAAPGFAVLSEKQRADIEDVSAMLTSNLEKITEHGKRADGIVKAMLEHSRGSSGERRIVDLNALIEEALNLAYHGARAQDQSFNITLERDFGPGISPIEVNPQDMTRVFLNIFANGFYATTKRARDGGDAGFVPTLKVSTRDTGDAVEIRVRDNGTGIPDDLRDKIFQPFVTSKPSGEGTGLGLSITYDIVTQQHGGTIVAESNVREYSEFTIRLPRSL